MELKYEQNNANVTIHITGDIDFEGDFLLNEKFEEILAIEGIKHIIMNLSRVDTSISAGIGRLVKFHKQIASRNQTLEVKGISDNLFKLFKEINLEKLFPINR
jgi:anti-anti-sigma factor